MHGQSVCFATLQRPRTSLTFSFSFDCPWCQILESHYAWRYHMGRAMRFQNDIDVFVWGFCRKYGRRDADTESDGSMCERHRRMG